jgi:PAS domain S-box-containing protein
MKMAAGYRKVIVIIVLIFLCGLLSAPVLADEQQRVITVVMDNNYPPFSFLDAQGNLQGITIDQWNLWEQKTGIHAELYGMDWSDAQIQMQAGKFDVIDTMFYNEDRAKIYDFGPPYATINTPIFFNKNISGISSPESARGFVVAVKSGDSAIPVLKNAGVTSLMEFNNYSEIIDAARDGRVDVFCVDEPPALYFLYKDGISDQFYMTQPLYSGELHRAVKKGDTKTLQIVNDGFAKISSSEYSEIDRKWYGTPLVSAEYLQYIIAGGFGIIILLSVLLLVNHTLKIKVAQKTAELNAELEQRRKAEGEAHRANAELHTAYEQLARTGEELRKNFEELRERENVIRESEEKYRTLVETTGTGFVIIDPDGRVLDANPEYVRLSGHTSLDEIIGRKVTEWTAKDDQEKNTEAVRQCMRDGFIRNFEVNYADVSGHITPVEINATVLRSGTTVQIHTLCRDITERKRAEEAIQKSELEWQTTFNAITDAVFLLDDKGRIIRHNRALELFTGKTTDEIDGRYCYEIMHGTASPIESCPNVKAQKSRQRESIELKIGNRWVIFAIDPIFTEEGTFSGAVHLLIDITDRKLAEEALNQARKKLSFLNAITFSDIKNSIFSLSAYLELEKILPTDEKLPQFKENERKIVQTIEESLKFTGIYQSLGLKPPLWQNVQQSFLLGISHTDISKLSRTLNVERLEIYADPLLENVFFILAENIILHGKNATEISLSFRETDYGLVLVFEDNGVGIPHDIKEKIFDRKYVEMKGTGLFLTSEILSITGITIKETGEPGKGARFEMTVPKGAYRFTGAQ